jgi:putative hydrolase of the HAD superfamily
MDVVERLQMRDLPCYVATNQEQYRTRYMRYAMDFDTEFERLFSSAEIGAKKPEEVFYHAVHDYIADEHGIAKDDVLFWDDEEANVEAAANYGWDAKLFKDVSSFTAVMEDRLD